MKRYAFIDVQNTASTTQRMLGFVIDWAKVTLLAPQVHLEAVTKNITVKTPDGQYAKEAITLTFSCKDSAVVPNPAQATVTNSTGVNVVEPAGCSLQATVNNPKYKQNTYSNSSRMRLSKK